MTALWVRTSWIKRSRGAAEAARRNAVPVAFRLPDATSPSVYEVLADEKRGFEPHWSRHVELRTAEVGLHEEDGRLRVYLSTVPYGMPRRHRRPPAVRLAVGEWLRWQVNYRFPPLYSDEWTYRLDTLNLAYGDIQEGTFLGVPAHHVDERAHLR